MKLIYLRIFRKTAKRNFKEKKAIHGKNVETIHLYVKILMGTKYLLVFE